MEAAAAGRKLQRQQTAPVTGSHSLKHASQTDGPEIEQNLGLGRGLGLAACAVDGSCKVEYSLNIHPLEAQALV